MNANGGAYFSNKLCQDVNKLVQPLVKERMQGNTPRAAAARSANQAIVEGKVPHGFQDALKNVVTTALTEGAKLLIGLAVSMVTKRCSLM